MLASKFFDDVYYNNAYCAFDFPSFAASLWQPRMTTVSHVLTDARVGGISNAEVNSLEMEMLRVRLRTRPRP